MDIWQIASQYMKIPQQKSQVELSSWTSSGAWFVEHLKISSMHPQIGEVIPNRIATANAKFTQKISRPIMELGQFGEMKTMVGRTGKKSMVIEIVGNVFGINRTLSLNLHRNRVSIQSRNFFAILIYTILGVVIIFNSRCFPSQVQW